jgi:type II secretory pathway component PulF
MEFGDVMVDFIDKLRNWAGLLFAGVVIFGIIVWWIDRKMNNK